MTDQRLPDPEERRRALLQFLATATVGGVRVESQSAERAVITTRRWGGLLGRRKQIVRIDEPGNVIVEDA